MSSELFFERVGDTAGAKKRHLLEYMRSYKQDTADFGYLGESEEEERKQFAPRTAQTTKAAMVAELMLGEVSPAPEEGPSAFGIEELVYGPMEVAVTKTLYLLDEQQSMDKVKCFPTQHTIKSQRTIHQ